MQTLPSFVGLRAGLAAPRPAPRAAPAPRASSRQLAVRASTLAAPATLDVKTLDGAAAGTASLALRVAEDTSAKGLVHRYLVLVRQNARRVRAAPRRPAAPPATPPAARPNLRRAPRRAAPH